MHLYDLLQERPSIKFLKRRCTQGGFDALQCLILKFLGSSSAQTSVDYHGNKIVDGMGKWESPASDCSPVDCCHQGITLNFSGRELWINHDLALLMCVQSTITGSEDIVSFYSLLTEHSYLLSKPMGSLQKQSLEMLDLICPLCLIKQGKKICVYLIKEKNPEISMTKENRLAFL